MNTNEYGQISFSTDEIISMIYAGQNIDHCVLNDSIETSKHNQNYKNFQIPALKQHQIINQNPIDFHINMSSTWQMPDNYKNFDIVNYLLKCLIDKGYTSTEYKNRLQEELVEFEKREMFNILRFLKYLMDTCEYNNIITGIGRGSSVSSLVLHLLDVHFIDPIKYNLDYKEFLR